MERPDCYYHANNPDIYTFVFPHPNARGDYPMLRLYDSDQWPYSPFLYGEYHPGQPNEHLGEHIALKALSDIVRDRFYRKLGG